MTNPSSLHAQTRLPVIGAPMFLVSGPELVIAQCAAGIVGTFPSLNARPQEQLHAWISRIEDGLAARRRADPSARVAPYGVNLIVHPSNARWEGDLAICAERRVPLVITSLHPPEAVVRAMHAHGGLVFHDVTTVRHAKRALAAGVDGLILPDLLRPLLSEGRLTPTAYGLWAPRFSAGRPRRRRHPARH